jgi:hypothetical protein
MVDKKTTKKNLKKIRAIERNKNYRYLNPGAVNNDAMDRVREMHTLLKTRGASDNLISAVIANSNRETGGKFDPAMKQTNGGAIGIVQWDGDRRDNLKNYAKNTGNSWDDMTTQVDFLMKELREKPRLLNEINNAETVRDAARVFHYKFEKDESSSIYNHPDPEHELHHSKNNNALNRQDMAEYWDKAFQSPEFSPNQELTLEGLAHPTQPEFSPKPDEPLKSEIPPVPDFNDELKSEIPPVPDFNEELKSEIAPIPNLPVSAPGTGIEVPTVTPEPDVYPDTGAIHTPFKIDEIPNTFFKPRVFDHDLITQPGTVSAQSIVGAYRGERPGIVAQTAHAFKEANSAIQAGGALIDFIGQQNPIQDPVDPDFNPMNPDAVRDLPPKYWPYVTGAKSPNDQAARRKAILERMEDDERYASGSLTWKLLGGFAGAATDPLTYLIPMAAGFKSARILEQVLGNTLKSSASIAAYSLAHESAVQANKAGGNLEDLATNAFVDTVFGMALVGAGSTINYAARSAKLWETRRAFNFAADGIRIDPEVNEAGELTGKIKATLAPGETPTIENAQLTRAAQLYADESLAKTGLLKLPYVGAGFERVFGNKFLGTPSMMAASSPYKAVKSFFNRIAPVGPMTEGELAGEARQDSAYDHYAFYRDYAKEISSFTRQQFYKANGMSEKDNSANALKNFRQKYTQGQTVTEKEFGEEVRSIMNTEGYKSDLPEAHAAADAIHKFYEGLGQDLFRAMGKEGTFLDPRTAWRYLPQNYNIEAMINREGDWIDLTVREYARQDELINKVEAPGRNSDARIESLRNQLKITPEDTRLYRDLKSQLRAAEGLRTRQQDEMVNTIRNDKQYHILLEDRVMFDSKEAEQLKSLLEPVGKAEKLHAKEKDAYDEFQVGFEELDAERRKLEQRQKRARESKNPDQKLIEERQARLDEIMAGRKELLNRQKVLSERVKRAEEGVEKIKEKLQEDALSGKIDRKYFRVDGNEVKFHDPNVKPKLRRPFTDANHMTLTARQVFNSITNQSPEDLIMGVFGHLDPSVNPGSSHLKSRTHLIDSEVYNKAGFLDPDVGKSVSSYASSMGRIIGFKRAFPEFSDGVGMEGVLRAFEAEHMERKLKLKTKEGTPEGNKERTKLDKEYRDAKKFMKDTYNTYMGTYSQAKPEVVRRLNILKNLVAAAKLGSVPVYQLSEMGAILMKTSIMPFFGQGMKPLVKSLFTRGEGIEAETYKANAANAYLATYTVRNGYAQRMIDSDTMSSAALGGRVADGVSHLSHVSGNLFGTNFIANVNEQWMASSFQSEVMQAMYAHAEGKLTQNQRIKMARYGLDVEKESKRFIDNFEKSEGWSKDGGHQSMYWTWEDLEASNRMAMSIRRAVNDTVVNSNVFTSPYWTQTPFGGALFMFHGWAYGALNKYTIPLMQRQTAENMLGLGVLVGLSMFAEPMLRIVHGKEMYADDATWYGEAYKGLDYSGILGPYAGWLQDFNNMTGGAIMPHLQTERVKQREGGLRALGGPLVGYMDDAISTLSHLAIGDFTQGDAGKAYRLAPLSSAIAGPQHFIYKLIENSGLPQTRAQAEPYSWRQKLYGEG